VSEYQTITLEQSGPIARITLNRPDAANGMNDTMTRELADAARRCDTEATKVVVLTGSGRFFCVGGDLKSFAAAPSRSRRHRAAGGTSRASPTTCTARSRRSHA
jgi:2-(1,2-epoxy-1,2-dihydrophenyl)acetyl-CoA isomerase